MPGGRNVAPSVHQRRHPALVARHIAGTPTRRPHGQPAAHRRCWRRRGRARVRGRPSAADPLGADDTSAFSLATIGDVTGWSADDLQSASEDADVTEFLRPEDGAWDPEHPNDFYFVTTASFSGPSRLWRLRFADVTDPTASGTIQLLLEGTEGQRMMDNLTLDRAGHVLIQEDPGNQAHIAKIWQYDIRSDTLTEIAHHDPDRFLAGGSGFLTQDEESSGIIDASDTLGPGWFLFDVQAHYAIAGELVQGGQLLALYNPDSVE
jgi:hypothetical protein